MLEYRSAPGDTGELARKSLCQLPRETPADSDFPTGQGQWSGGASSLLLCEHVTESGGDNMWRAQSHCSEEKETIREEGQ